MATNDKYDRQLRLWGPHGQRKLMNSHILLIHANGVGSETLKNLVLPGIGNFTILDDHIVTHHDLSCNFFVTPNHLGKPRAEVVSELLCEMNPDVRGGAKVANFLNVFQNEPEFFTRFNLIIASNLPENQLLALGKLCSERSINIISLRSYGLIGSIRLQLPGHSIIESKRDRAFPDLRISAPFPELNEYFHKYYGGNWNDLSSEQHSHIPYVVILHFALEEFRRQNNGEIPKSEDQKEKFQQLIKSMARSYDHESNFQEAVDHYYLAYRSPKPSDELNALLEQYRNKNITPYLSSFEYMLHALDIFIRTTGQTQGFPPLPGVIPDMTATTEAYVNLQAAYHAKAEQDRTLFKQILNQLIQSTKAIIEISDEEIDLFCKNSQTISYVATSTIAAELEEFASAENICDTIAYDTFETDPLQTPLIWYLALRAVDGFYSNYARFPGSNDDALEHDQKEVFNEMLKLARKLNIPEHLIESSSAANSPSEGDPSEKMETESSSQPALITKNHAIEITRYGGCELHNICSVIGGIASQEAVKIITNQYEPFDNTYVFNGVATCGAVYTL